MSRGFLMRMQAAGRWPAGALAGWLVASLLCAMAPGCASNVALSPTVDATLGDAVDAPPDAAAGEAGSGPTPDGGPPCLVDEQCSSSELGFRRVCDPETHRCAFCAPSRADTCGAAEFCSEGRCLPGCARDQACAATPATPRCNLASHRCVACVADADCGTYAGARPVCTDGVCGLRCDAGRGDCDGLASNGCETDLTTTIARCGRCDNRCPDPPGGVAVCADSRCGVTCNAPLLNCDGDVTNGCEADPRVDARHCGACGRACPTTAHATAMCAAGACASRCDDGFGDCNGEVADGCEADLARDVAHCGACGVRCAARPHATPACATGRCQYACEEGFADCDGDPANGCEVDTRTSLMHCGACGAACGARAHATVACAAGRCGATCDAGFGDCDGDPANGCEVDLRTSAAHCGACGAACMSGATCAGGMCQACPAGQTYCGGRCVNLQTDHDHCGACGRDCLRGTCAAGACTPYLLATLPTSRAAGLAFDGTYLYSGGHFEGTLYRVAVAPPSTPERLYAGNAYLMGLQWSAGTLFWNSYRESNVYSAPASGGGAVTAAALGVSDPGDILVEDDFIYAVSYQSSTSPIYRRPRGAGAPALFATVPENGGGELLRMPSGDILVSGQYHDTIWRVTPTGAVSVLTRLGAGRAAQQLATDGRSLYVCSYTGFPGQILRVDLATLAVSVVATGLESPFGFIVTDSMIYFSNYFAHDIWAMRK